MKTTIFRMLILITVLQLPTQLQAQVTIGSLTDPVPAALLDLKQNISGNPDANNETVDQDGGGLVLPRVSLQSLTTLEPFVSTSNTYWADKSNTYADKLHTGQGTWHLYCLIIHNSLVKTLNTIEATVAPSGSSDAPVGL